MLVDSIADRGPERVVFLDRGFESDAAKANTAIALRRHADSTQNVPGPSTTPRGTSDASGADPRRPAAKYAPSGTYAPSSYRSVTTSKGRSSR